MNTHAGDPTTVSLRYELHPPDVEAHFRADSLPRDRTIAASLMLVAAVFHAISFPVSLTGLPDRETLLLMWAGRGVNLVVALVSAVAVRRARTARRYDGVVTLWAGLLFAGGLYENVLLPSDYFGFVAWDVFLVMAVYAALPLPLARQASLALTLSVGDVLILALMKTGVVQFALLDVSLAFFGGNVAGFLASSQAHRWRRREFVALQREVEAREALERAQQDVRTLQGIITICSSCKRVHTDTGHWEQVELYVRNHSEAEFSHGLCPPCIQKLYPELMTGEHDVRG